MGSAWLFQQFDRVTTLIIGKKAALLTTVFVLALAGCAREVILEGERLDVRAPLLGTLPLDATEVAEVPAATNLSVTISVPAQVANAEWTHRGGNATHTGPNGQLSLNPTRVWSVDIGASNNRRSRVSGAPVVSGGRVFALDAVATLTAVSTAGAKLWSADLTPDFDGGSEVSGGGIAASGGRVFATTGYGELIAFDAATGAVAWRQRFDAPVSGAPTTDGGAVYVVGRDGSATAVDAKSGKMLWQQQATPSRSGLTGVSSPAVSETEVYFPFASGEISVVSKSGGERVWGAAVGGQRNGLAYTGIGDLTGDPVLAGGVLYVGSASGRTVAIDAKTGLRLWTANEGAMNPPLVVGGSVFVVSDDAHLIRLDGATGDVIWSVEMPYFIQTKPKKLKAVTAHFGPVLAGGKIVVASTDGQLRLFNPTDGSLAGGAEIPGGAASLPALAGGLLFVTGGNGQLHAFR
ncbi:MAG: hypothetical protein RIR95_1203 [Pseudomonadota bacterium]